jgi:hypothetical protein
VSYFTKDETQEPKKLEWGESPFDNMTRDELIRHCQRLYLATQRLHDVANAFRTKDTEIPFWKSGRGARGFEMGQQALDAVSEGFDAESMHRNFFRFATDLLFEDRPGLEIHSRWVACPKCGHVLVPAKESLRFDGVECKEVVPNTTCDGLLRPIEWADLAPVAKKAEHTDLEVMRF